MQHNPCMPRSKRRGMYQSFTTCTYPASQPTHILYIGASPSHCRLHVCSSCPVPMRNDRRILKRPYFFLPTLQHGQGRHCSASVQCSYMDCRLHPSIHPCHGIFPQAASNASHHLSLSLAAKSPSPMLPPLSPFSPLLDQVIISHQLSLLVYRK